LVTQQNQTGDPTPLDPKVKYYIMYLPFYYIKYYTKYYINRFEDPEKLIRGPYTFRSTGKVLYNVLTFLLYKVLYKVLYDSFWGPRKVKQGTLHL
jgi:hypothetical protein